MFNIKEFNIKEYYKNNPYCSILIAGKRGSGKTVYIKWFLKQVHLAQIVKPENIILFKETEFDTEFYDQYVHSDMLIDWRPDILNKILNSQAVDIKKFGKKNVDRIMIVFDDCNIQIQRQKNLLLDTLFKNGRHYNITFIFATQYVSSISPVYVANVDLLILKNTLDFNVVERIRKSYFSGITITRFLKLLGELFRINKYINIIFDNNEHQCIIDITLFNVKIVTRKIT